MKLEKINELISHYFHKTLIIDLIWLLVLMIDLACEWKEMRFFRLLFLIRIMEHSKKVEDFENDLITNFEREQYWGVVKVFLLNFFLAHAMGVILMGLAELSPQENWMRSSGVF